MKYQLIKIDKPHHRGRCEVVSAVSTIISILTVQETTALLLAYSQVAQANPSESYPKFDSDEPGQTQIISIPACTHRWLRVRS